MDTCEIIKYQERIWSWLINSGQPLSPYLREWYKENVVKYCFATVFTIRERWEVSKYWDRSSMNVVGNLKTIFNLPTQNFNLLSRISAKRSSNLSLNTTGDRVLSTFWDALSTFVTMFFISVWNLFLSGLSSLVLVVPLGAQRTNPNLCSHGSPSNQIFSHSLHIPQIVSPPK